MDYTLPWDEAIRKGTPQTQKDSHVWEVGNKYPAFHSSVVDEEIICVNFGANSRTSARKAAEWGREQGLILKHPRVLLALAEKLREELQELIQDSAKNSVRLVSPQERDYLDESLVVGVFVGGSAYLADLFNALRKWDDGSWFCFGREQETV